MNIYSYVQAPVRDGDVVFRQYRVLLVVMFGLCVVCATVMLWLVHNQTDPVLQGLYWKELFILAFLAISGGWILIRMWRSFSRENWLLRFDDRRLLLKIGEPLSRDPGRVSVLEMDRNEVEWIRSNRSGRIQGDIPAKDMRAHNCLEIKLRNVELTELRACIVTASAPRLWLGWMLDSDIPVSVTEDGLIRLDWRYKRTWMTPSLKETLRMLEQVVPVQAETPGGKVFEVSVKP